MRATAHLYSASAIRTASERGRRERPPAGPAGSFTRWKREFLTCVETATETVRARHLSCAFFFVLLSASLQAQASERLNVCTLSFNSPDEVAVFKARLPQDAFNVIDLSPPPLLERATPMTSDEPAPTSGRRREGAWLPPLCRNDMRCDVLVISAEFAGRFFGTYGNSLSLQEMEEASCMRSCQGLFHSPLEVFLLACNTLATKDADRRTPDEYLQVLREHGFDRAAAERVVALRYGPLGPSFREALRRIFAGVPRIYGFESIAPRGEYTARVLGEYFEKKGDYRSFLNTAGRSTARNSELLSAFRDTLLVQTHGLMASEPAAADRALVCSLYDRTVSTSAGLRTVERFMDRADFLAFLPSIEVFMSRHRAEQLTPDELRLFDEIRGRKKAREAVLRLVRGLDVCALQMELASLAVQLQWMDHREFRALALEGTKKLLGVPVSTETVDIMCEISKHERLGDVFTSKDLSSEFFTSAEGIRFVDCLAPTDRAVDARLVASLDSPDVSARVWAAYALSHRPALTDEELMRIATHLSGATAEEREQLHWLFYSQPGRLSPKVRKAIAARDPQLAAVLPPEPLPAGGATRPKH